MPSFFWIFPASLGVLIEPRQKGVKEFHVLLDMGRLQDSQWSCRDVSFSASFLVSEGHLLLLRFPRCFLDPTAACKVSMKGTNVTFTASFCLTPLCRIFGISCQDVCVRLVSQIKAWQITESCQSEGERCSYEVRNISINYRIAELSEIIMEDIIVWKKRAEEHVKNAFEIVLPTILIPPQKNPEIIQMWMAEACSFPLRDNVHHEIISYKQ